VLLTESKRDYTLLRYRLHKTRTGLGAMLNVAGAGIDVCVCVCLKGDGVCEIASVCMFARPCLCGRRPPALYARTRTGNQTQHNPHPLQHTPQNQTTQGATPSSMHTASVPNPPPPKIKKTHTYTYTPTKTIHHASPHARRQGATPSSTRTGSVPTRRCTTRRTPSGSRGCKRPRMQRLGVCMCVCVVCVCLYMGV
jgi:hypothetical protein